jgi:hypothetical protein
MPTRELHVDVRPAALHGVPHLDQSVVCLEQQKEQHCGNHSDGYETKRNVQVLSFSEFLVTERMEAFYGNRFSILAIPAILAILAI